MKNIGIITHNLPYNLGNRQNAGIFVYDIAQEIAVNNSVVIFCPAEGGRKSKLGKLSIINFPVISGNKLGNLKFYNPVDIFRFIIFFISGTFSLVRFITHKNITVNISMWAFPSGVFAYLAKIFFGIPYVTWCLGSDIYVFAKKPILKNIIRLILRNSSFVFADGLDLSHKVEKLSGKKCIFIPSATNVKYRRKAFLKSKNIINLVYVGRLELIKGPDILLRALTLIKKDISRFIIHIIGDGSLLESLKKKAIDNNISNQIVFHGNIDFREISNIVNKADWLIIPSRSDSIPLVFSESMKCGTPIIASNLPDLKYLIDKYKVGILFKKNDSRGLANLITKLPKLNSDRVYFFKNTKIAAKDFNIEKSAHEVISYIDNI